MSAASGPRSESDLAESLRDLFNLAQDILADTDPDHDFADVRVDDLGSYLTRDEGVELRFPNGAVFLLMVKQHTNASGPDPDGD